MKKIDEMTIPEVIELCGRVQFSHKKTASLFSNRLNKQEQAQLLSDLSSSGTEANTQYTSGLNAGELELNDTLLNNVSNPKSKDAYKHLSAERQRQAINKKLYENFGIGEVV